MDNKVKWEVPKETEKEVVLEEGKAESETEEITKDGSETEQTESLEEVLGVEKIAELRGSLFGVKLGDNDTLKKLFDDMNKEIKERLSVQS